MERVKVLVTPPPDIGAEILNLESSALLDSPVEFISTGSIMLNLAASNKGIDGGWARNRVSNIVGDGSSGKTLVALEFCAYCFYKLKHRASKLWPRPKKVHIVYNNVEGVMDFPIAMMYGARFEEDVEWIQTSTVQGFGNDFFGRINKLPSDECLIYVIDSWDALDSEEELASYVDSISKGEAPSGSYDLGKQRYASKRFFKMVCGSMLGKDVTLMVISQVRQKIGVTFGEKTYRAGGDALNFYTHQVCWLAEKQKLTKQSLGHKMAYGIKVRSRFKRNKAAKPFREAEFDIIYDWGIDDVRSMVDHFFTKPKEGVRWGSKRYHYEEFIEYIENNVAQYIKLAKQVTDRWHKAEKNVNPKFGKNKYDKETGASAG